MKIVINVCFGDYGLSIEAMKRLIELKSPAIEALDIDTYFGKEHKDKRLKEWMSRSKDVGDGYINDTFGSSLFKDGIFYNYNRSIRTDPDLIRVVEEMGKDADGCFAELKVIEIPDGIEYEIEEYDGNEHIAEVHETWR